MVCFCKTVNHKFKPLSTRQRHRKGSFILERRRKRKRHALPVFRDVPFLIDNIIVIFSEQFK